MELSRLSPESYQFFMTMARNCENMIEKDTDCIHIKHIAFVLKHIHLAEDSVPTLPTEPTLPTRLCASNEKNAELETSFFLMLAIVSMIWLFGLIQLYFLCRRHWHRDRYTDEEEVIFARRENHSFDSEPSYPGMEETKPLCDHNKF